MTGMIFVVGNSRSGTTMLGRIFGNHSRVYTFGELHFFENQIDAMAIHERPVWPESRCIQLLERLMTSARDGFFCKVILGKYRTEAEYILAQSLASDPVSVYAAFLAYETSRHGKIIPCEQTPRYLFFAAEILQAFPEAKIINMVRDPRDVLLSQKNKWRRRFLGAKNIPLYEAFRAWVNYHPYTISLLWLGALRKAQQMESHPRFTSIRFEDLLAQPEVTTRKLCEFAELPFQPEMLNVPQIGSSTGYDKPLQKGIDGSRTGGWRKGGLTATEIAICQRVADSQMKRLDYAITEISTTMLHHAFSMLLFMVKALMALLLNLNRTKNLHETLRRRLAGRSK